MRILFRPLLIKIGTATLAFSDQIKFIPLWLLLIGALACSMPGLPLNQATPLPTVMPSPLPTFTPTATPLPTATPTPLPAARVELGDLAIFYGDWESAFSEFRKALETSPDVEVQYAARLGIGRTHLLAGELPEGEHRALARHVEGCAGCARWASSTAAGSCRARGDTSCWSSSCSWIKR